MGHELDRSLALRACEHAEACEESVIRESVRDSEDVHLHASSCITTFFVPRARPWEAAAALPTGLLSVRGASGSDAA
jgi:hypothetical protein